MTYHKHIPVGTTYTGTEPPRYVPHVPAPMTDADVADAFGVRRKLDTRPLSEADTWPSVAASQPQHPPLLARLPLDPHPAPVARRLSCAPAPRHHGWLYWRLWWLRRDVEALVDEARAHTGWLGQLAFLVALAACSAGFVVAVLLVWFALTSAGL